MAERRKRRKWSDEEKRRIVAQTKVPGVSVPQVARRYDVNANLIFKWVRDPRYCSAVDHEPENMNFLPVEVQQNSLPVESVQKRPDAPGSIKISLASGHHLEISGIFDTDTIVRLVRGLSE
jgi:transposase